MTTAFVLSGGGSLGAVQVGMLQALAEQQITPDLLVGTSAGALNAAFIAGYGLNPEGVGALAEVWRRLHARSLFSIDPRRALSALAGRNNALCTDRGLRDLLHRHLRFERLEDSPIPLQVVATDLLTGQEVALCEGDAQSAILSSCAIPGVFPTIQHHEMTLVDGGLANNTAVSQAVMAGADTVYVLSSGYACALTHPPRTPLGTAIHALTLLTHQRLVADVALYADQVNLIVLPPPCPLRVSPIDFGRAHELIRAAHTHSLTWLAEDGGHRPHPELHIALHVHRTTETLADT